MNKPVLVALSGGVDSSVAALCLLERGAEVVGVTLRLADPCGRPGSRTCCSFEDALDAREVCRHLGIEHRVLDHSEAFGRLVVEPFARAYARGITPNPCIVCNERVKFGSLWRYAAGEGFGSLATGHHARLVEGPGGVELRRGADPLKDQSYVLFHLDAEQRCRTLFPVGGMTKGEVRARAAAAGLPTAHKEESQDICFVPEGGYAAFLEARGTPSRPGFIRHVDGRILGRHGGIHRFTVGQRRGIRIPAQGPLYVVRVDPPTGEVTVGPRSAVARPSFSVSEWRWHREPGGRSASALVQTRYRQEPSPAELLEDGNRVVVRWTGEPRISAPGQAAVAYVGDAVAGGGWIL